ncbi:N-6 DNA methylase, partial [Candidatus Sumerlaeota bacterium]|nr:N-6 DNA methylase [Candidatus Sumerlaeota bacterium]
MKNPPKIAPYRQNFPQLLEEFCRQIGEARARNFHHDQRRHLFMNFLKEAFPHVETVEVELEKKVFGAEIRGYIDALYQTTIFEFKTDFDRERPTALNELKKYFKSRPRPHEYIAVLTDGERFELFQWDRGDVDSISTFILTPENPLAAYYRLDQFLKTETPRTPTSFDIVTMFGPHSAVFRHAAALMHQIYATVEKDSAVVIKFREWNKLIAKVYGSELGYADLFITHTYLVILSRLMVARALFPKEKRDPGAYRGIMDGKYFTQKNLPNLAEPDFFSWALGTPGESSFVGLIAKIEKHLAKYDFSSTNEDILKELYQGLVDPEKRHDLGEYYTPDWLAELTLEKAGYNGGSLLDPSCGSGTFLMCAV